MSSYLLFTVATEVTSNSMWDRAVAVKHSFVNIQNKDNYI